MLLCGKAQSGRNANAWRRAASASASRPLAHQGQTKVVVPIGITGVACDGLSSGLFRLPGMSCQRKHPGKIDPGIGEVGRNLHCRAIAGGAFVVAANIAEDVAKVVVRRDRVWFQRQRAACGAFGVGEPTQFAQDRGMIRMQLSLCRSAHDCRPKMGVSLCLPVVVVGQ